MTKNNYGNDPFPREEANIYAIRQSDSHSHISAHNRLLPSVPCKVIYEELRQSGKKGAWQVEHSVPRSKGGPDHLNTLFAACVSCKLRQEQQDDSAARGWNGKRCAPLNREKRKQAKFDNGLAGAIAGGYFCGRSDRRPAKGGLSEL